MKTFCVYIHKNKINNKIYVGQTCQVPQYRWGTSGQNYSNSPHFYSAIKKYGWNNFEHIIIKKDLTQQEANDLEISLIKKYNSTNPKYGYNSCKGGNSRIPNEITRQRQSLSAQNRPIVSDKTKMKLSKIGKGRKRSLETRQKLSKAAKEREAKRTSPTRKVRCLNTGEVFPTLRAAADWCGLIGASGISLVCQKRKQKTAGVHPITKEKLKWEYVDD